MMTTTKSREGKSLVPFHHHRVGGESGNEVSYLIGEFVRRSYNTSPVPHIFHFIVAVQLPDNTHSIPEYNIIDSGVP